MVERLLPPLRLLTVFETVLRAGSIQRAAADLNVTQPAVSQAVRNLEDYVGTPLFDRSVRPAALTPAGRILQIGVSEGLGRIADSIEQLRSIRAVEDSSLTIACTVGTATYWLMPRLAGFYEEHPDVAVNVMTTAGAPDVLPGVDLVIRYGSGDWRDGHTVKLFDEKVVPVCSPAVAARINAEGSLAAATLLHVMSDDKSWLTWKEYFDLNKLQENRMLGRYFTNYVQATQAALSGQGVMLGWESNTGDLVREGRLVALEGNEYYPKEAFFLVVPARSEQKRSCQLFKNWITSAMAAERS
jgi:DNA-binding transcriptional LysR family regulator